MLDPSDIYLSYAGSLAPENPIHRRLAGLRCGDRLQLLEQENGTLDLCTGSGRPVARLSGKGCAQWREHLASIKTIRVIALPQRRREDDDPEYQGRCRTDRWEYPLVEIVYRI